MINNLKYLIPSQITISIEQTFNAYGIIIAL